MPKNNRICLNCGNPYYVCRSCISMHSWKNVCCSTDCFRELMRKTMQTEEIVEPKINIEGEIKDMYVVLKNNDKAMVEGYDIKLGRFDCDDKQTHTKDDIDHIEITLEELQTLAE